MALPSGNFSSPNSGQLFVNFSGSFTAYNPDFGSGASDILCRCEVFDETGTLRGNGLLSRLNGGVTLIVDYPGGGVVWTASITEVNHTIKGPGWVSLVARISARLAKR